MKEELKRAIKAKLGMVEYYDPHNEILVIPSVEAGRIIDEVFTRHEESICPEITDKCESCISSRKRGYESPCDTCGELINGFISNYIPTCHGKGRVTNED